jgi:hypothetical protein
VHVTFAVAFVPLLLHVIVRWQRVRSPARFASRRAVLRYAAPGQREWPSGAGRGGVATTGWSGARRFTGSRVQQPHRERISGNKLFSVEAGSRPAHGGCVFMAQWTSRRPMRSPTCRRSSLYRPRGSRLHRRLFTERGLDRVSGERGRTPSRRTTEARASCSTPRPGTRRYYSLDDAERLLPRHNGRR